MQGEGCKFRGRADRNVRVSCGTAPSQAGQSRATLPSHPCAPQSPAQSPGSKPRALCLSGQHLPFSRLKIARIWHTQGTCPGIISTCHVQRWMGTGWYLTGMCPPCPTPSSSSPRAEGQGRLTPRELGLFPEEGEVSRDWAFPGISPEMCVRRSFAGFRVSLEALGMLIFRGRKGQKGHHRP